MSLAEQVDRWKAKAAAELTPQRLEGGVEVAFDRASTLARRHLGAATGELVDEVLDELRPLAPAIARRGVATFRVVLEALWRGDPAAAERAWRELEGLDPAERRARLRDLIVAADDAVTQAERDLEELLAGLGRAGKLALELAIPILLAVL